MSTLWITDPWETLDHPRDTSLRLIEECLIQGVPASWADVRSLRLRNGEVTIDAAVVEGVFPGRVAKAFRLAPSQPVRPREFRRILYRTDPPVDHSYLHPLQLLLLSLGGSIDGTRGTEIVNPPSVLLGANEKLEPALLGPLMPPTVVSSQWAVLEAFGRSEKQAVLKPLHQAQSKGVELVHWTGAEGATAARELIRAATEDFRRPVLLQRYLDGIVEGEKRLWFLNGQLLAVARKRPKHGEFRVNMDQGGTLALTDLEPPEKKTAVEIGKRLRARKIRMAAVDLIDGLVTDFNLTSPGLLPAMETLIGTNLAQPIVESLVKPWR